MYIFGLQKLTLLDYPDHLAATLFLSGCNFRCPFCHNSGLVLHENYENADPDDLFSEDEIFDFLKKRVGMLDGVCISGGEPSLHRELPGLISRIRDLGYEVKLDTNGSCPDMLRELLDGHLLDYVAMDIKAGRKAYRTVAGLGESAEASETGSENGQSLLEKIQRSIDMIRNSRISYEFRTTVVKGLHTEEDFEDIARWLAGSQRYYLQSFRDCDTILLPDHSFSAFSEEEMLRFLSIVKKTIPNASLRGMEP